jgi:regulator of protease activity HflC (stomatin/prohibitin superfamily)
MRWPTVAASCLPLFACATVPPGKTGVVLHASEVDRKPLSEGLHWVGPFDQVETYDLRAQERNEDLDALSADGAPLEAHASMITFHPAPDEVVALARETGPDYYNVLVRPVLRSSLRRVLAGLRADELNVAGSGRVERAVTDDVFRRLRPHHIIFDSITLRTLRIAPRTQAYQVVVATGVKQQEALTARELVDLARKQAQARQDEARGIVAAFGLIAPTLSPRVLGDAAQRAWSHLLTASSTHVEVRSSNQPYVLEVEP